MPRAPSPEFNFVGAELTSDPCESQYAGELITDTDEVTVLMNKISQVSAQDCSPNQRAERMLADHEEVMAYFEQDLV